MGLIGKLSEMRMKDPVEGVLRVVAISMPDPTATSANYRLEGVVSADGMMPTAITHHGMTSVSHWPSAGDELPVTVDREKPERLVIHWKDVPKGFDQAKSAAQQLAEQMRMGGTAAAGTGAAGGIDLNALISQVHTVVATQPGQAQVPTVSNDDILARGTAGNATVLGTFPPPVPVVKEGRTGVGLMLNVMVDGKPPYQIQNLYAVPNEKVGSLTPGALLPVKVDQTMPNLVAIDWNAIH